jgi:hypothetical protein
MSESFLSVDDIAQVEMIWLSALQPATQPRAWQNPKKTCRAKFAALDILR